MAFVLDHNVRGVQGLSIAYNVISARTEERLFCAHGPRVNPLATDMLKVVNLVRDCGLLPSFVFPSHIQGLVYPSGSKLGVRFDSRHIYGECVVVLSCGVPRTLCMRASHDDVKAVNKAKNSGDNKEINVPLPPRSLYVLTGDAMLKWKHGIKKIARPDEGTLPWWNRSGEARTYVFRSAKLYSNHVLSGGYPQALGDQACPAGPAYGAGGGCDGKGTACSGNCAATLATRRAQQGKFRVETRDPNDANKLLNLASKRNPNLASKETEERCATELLDNLKKCGVRRRFTGTEALFPGALAAHRRAQDAGVGLQEASSFQKPKFLLPSFEGGGRERASSSSSSSKTSAFVGTGHVLGSFSLPSSSSSSSSSSFSPFSSSSSSSALSPSSMSEDAQLKLAMEQSLMKSHATIDTSDDEDDDSDEDDFDDDDDDDDDGAVKDAKLAKRLSLDKHSSSSSSSSSLSSSLKKRERDRFNDDSDNAIINLCSDSESDDDNKKSKRRKTVAVAATPSPQSSPQPISKTAKETALEAMRQARIDALSGGVKAKS